MAHKLVLFDIDGTLITDGGASRAAFGDALSRVYGYSGDLRRYDFSGRTDPQITHMVLRDEGLTEHEINARLEEMWRVYLAGLEQNTQSGTVRALSGVREIVDALADRNDVVLALLTGNIEHGARLKLSPPQLNDFFPFGAFGSDSAVRDELPPFAVTRAEARHGHRFSGRDVVIIGDSIYDVRCGVPHGATTIAVASGKTPAKTLKAENPTFFFETLGDTKAVLEAIFA